MGGNIQIRGLPDDLYRRLSARASSHDRTIAEEALAILEEALASPSEKTPDVVDPAQRKKIEARRRAMIDWALR